jgi:GTP-binding protein HflX
LKSVEVALVTYPDSFTLQEAKSLAESMEAWRVNKVFTQKYLNYSEYGVGSGKAEEIRDFLKRLSKCKARNCG